MTNEEAIAALCDMGIIYPHRKQGGWHIPNVQWFHSEDEILSDWRVAGAVMERCIGCDINVDSGYGKGWEVTNMFAPGTNTGGQDYKYTKACNESLPRAIILAGLAALRNEKR